MKCPHCDVSIDEHEASPCLNAWVAEDVMKLGEIRRFHPDWFLEGAQTQFWVDDAYTLGDDRRYSTDMRAAWDVALDFTGRQYHVWLDGEDGFDWSRWDCKIWTPLDDPDHTDPLAEGWDESRDLNVRLASAPLAICRAALKAVDA